ncbi:hypothetical protein SEA_PLATTE_115 [Microbacterium phage Platte]|nr:hypothetical protein SEA_TANDEM_116 [Microbacterium phage Tandem]AWY06444.1 hypothetical protein SEA_TANDEM_5 [Microbacterium phage Tandem]QZD97601.1 hypothetical protein SEA_PLATTE_5 [Microbacterium phage Platte]QZD97707.1 hypothetical protein SEA_PLATTE_115 [Microbacterium phage Platte]
MSITLHTRRLAALHQGAAGAAQNANTLLRDYLGTPGADLASDEYVDLRRAARDAADKMDAAYLAYRRELTAALAAWAAAKPGDAVGTIWGPGVLVNRGTIAGFVRLHEGAAARRVEVEDVVSITAA